MPQMAPLMWTTLFLFFSSMLILTSIKIYSLNKMSDTKTMEITPMISPQNKLNWKW